MKSKTTITNSSIVKEISYNHDTNTLYALFNSGSTYEYKDVSEQEYQSIIEDVSVGSKLRKVTANKEYIKQ